MIFYKVGCNCYNVTAHNSNKELLVATITTPLMETDYVYLNMFLPYEDSSETKINTTYLRENQILEEAKKIIIKKMCKLRNDILDNISVIEFDNNTQLDKHFFSDNFASGRVYSNINRAKR